MPLLFIVVLCALVAAAPLSSAQVPTVSSGTPATQLPLTAATPPGDAALQASAGSIDLEPTLEVALDAQPSAPAAFDATTAYVPLKGGRLVAIDLATGKLRWTVEIATRFAPGVSDGLVLVAGDELLTALEASTGRAKWRIPVPGGFSAPPLADSGWAIAAPAGGDVMAVRATDGAVLWTRNVGAAVHRRPVVTSSGVYLSVEDGRVMSLSLDTGEPRWQKTLRGAPGDLLVLDDRLFVGADDKFFYCLDTKNGKRRWWQRTGGRPIGPAAVDTRQVYYVPLDNILWAFDRNNGGRKWHQPLPVRPSGGPIVIGDVVIVAGVAAEVYAYRTQTGEPAGKAVSPADLASPPQVVPGGTAGVTSIALVTREGIFKLLSSRVEPRPTALPYPLGGEIPLSVVSGLE